MGIHRIGLQGRQPAPGNGLALRCAAAVVAFLGALSGTVAVATNPVAASGTARYVAQGGSDTSNDCTSPTSPCATISHAVTQASSGDTINVSGTIDDHVTIGKSLTITQWISHAQAVVAGTNSGTPFTINSGSTVILNKLTIENGSNDVSHGGGGINNRGTLTLTDTTVMGNTGSSKSDGGGIANAGILTLTNSTVSQNTTAGIAAGGGIGNFGTLTLTKSAVSHNAGTNGAGILSGGGSATLTKSTVSDNTGNVGGSFGGGIQNSGGTLTLTNSTVSHNTATAGGGIENSGGTLTLTNSTISNNTATAGVGGGGIDVFSGTVMLNNSTLSGNSATQGGGIRTNNGASSSVLASTISANTATMAGKGGGISNGGSSQVGATILAGNSGANCASTPPSSLGYNVTDDANGTACGFTQSTDKVNANPNLGALAHNGGRTQTMLPPQRSPAAFLIPNPTTLDSTQVCPRTDQRGVPSFGDCTVGAVEAIPGVAPSLPSDESHRWTTGQSDAFLITATGTPTPTITRPPGPSGGRLPNGLRLSLSGDIANVFGTPAANAGGTYSIKLVAHNGVSPSSTQTVTLVVQQPPVLSLPPNGGTVGFKAGVASSVPWSVSAPATTWPHITQPVTYTTSGFPVGLNFNNNGNGTGTISGTLAKGTYGPMSIKASNVAGSSTTTFFIKAQ